MLERLTALMTSHHGPKIFVAALVFVLGSTAGVVVRAATDSSTDASDTNTAVAVNTTDDSEKIKLSFKVSKTKDDPSDPANAAAAVSSCENCRTIAIAIQAVIVLEDPSIISPTNLAIAINQNCTLCETYADARQHVITTDGPANFSKENRDRIKAIRDQLKQIKQDEKDGDLTFDQLKARVDALSAELADVLADEFRTSTNTPVPSPSPSAAGDSAVTTTPTDTTGSSDAPAESSPEPSPSVTETSSPSPTSSPGLST